MDYIKLFDNYNNDNKLKELVQGSDDYQSFLENVNVNSGLFILYRGSYFDGIENKSFFADELAHAEQYGENVDGLIIPNMKEIMHYDDEVFSELKEDMHITITGNYDYSYFEDYKDEIEDYESILKERIREIYSYYFKNDKLTDAMYQADCDENCVVDFVYDFCFEANNTYSEVSKTKSNDFLIPLMLYISTKVLDAPRNIISYDSIAFHGSIEYVVDDVSKYVKLSDVWKKYKQ